MKDELNVGDWILFRKDGKIMEGIIKSINGNQIEIDDDTIIIHR